MKVMSMMTPFARLLVLLVPILLALALGLHRIETQSIWFDEGYSWHAAVQSTVTDAANADATNPPLYYALLHGFVRGVGDSEFGLRIFSLLIGLPVIPLSAALAARSVPRDKRAQAASGAALTAAVLPALTWAAQEARMYTLLALLVVIAALAWEQLTRRPTSAAWVALLVAELLILYTHNSGVVVVLWLNVVTVLAWVSRRAVRRPDWRLWLSGQGIVGVLWLPYFIARFLDVTTANNAILSAPVITPGFALNVWLSFWVTPYERLADMAVSGWTVFVVALIGLGGAALTWRYGRWLVAHVVMLLAGLIAALIVLGNEYHGRYIVMIAPLVAAALGVALARLPRSANRIGMFAVVVGSIALSALRWDEGSAYRHDDARAMVTHYAAALDVGDTVLAWSYADRYDLAYYWRRLGVAARRVTLPEGADIDAVLPMLPTSGDVAVNVWYTQRADYRGMIGCVLGHGTTSPPRTFITYGMSSAMYPTPAQGLPARVMQWRIADERAEFARIEALPAFDSVVLNADQALCLPLALTLTRPVDVSLMALMIVRNSLGDEIARADAILATADQRTSESAAVGEVLRGFPVVRLPYGAPPVAYTFSLLIYDTTRRLYGYELIDDDTRSLERTFATLSPRRAQSWDAPPAQSAPILEVDGRTLYTVDVPSSARPGDDVRVTLGWMDGRGYILEWLNIDIAPDQPPGAIDLSLMDGQVYAALEIEDVPYMAVMPHVSQGVWGSLPGVGTLIGHTTMAIVRHEAPGTQLIWQAAGASDLSYTVFVQLIDAAGRVIAQSDRIPANGARPTTGWRAGEYIVDVHELVWNSVASPGDATLIAGMYNARSGERVRFEDGSDHVVLGRVTIP